MNPETEALAAVADRNNLDLANKMQVLFAKNERLLNMAKETRAHIRSLNAQGVIDLPTMEGILNKMSEAWVSND